MKKYPEFIHPRNISSTKFNVIMNYILINSKNFGLYIDLIESFFEGVSKDDELFFHPHPLNIIGFQKEISNKEKNLYFFGENKGKFIGYGILRGWDEGYDVPSLGILISKKYKGKGYGLDMMEYLEIQSRKKRAKRIRLTVLKKNLKAISLYKQLGYTLSDYDEFNLIGFKNLRN